MVVMTAHTEGWGGTELSRGARRPRAALDPAAGGGRGRGVLRKTGEGEHGRASHIEPSAATSLKLNGLKYA